jgi:hypothetical protein
MANLIFELIQGEIGAVMNFTLRYEDENGVEQLYSLAGKTCFLRAWRTDPEGRTIDDVACVADPDQTANKGKGTFTFNSTTAAIPEGEHRFRFKVLDGLGNPKYFPKDQNANYGTIIVSAAN